MPDFDIMWIPDQPRAAWPRWVRADGAKNDQLSFFPIGPSSSSLDTFPTQVRADQAARVIGLVRASSEPAKTCLGLNSSSSLKTAKAIADCARFSPHFSQEIGRPNRQKVVLQQSLIARAEEHPGADRPGFAVARHVL